MTETSGDDTGSALDGEGPGAGSMAATSRGAGAPRDPTPPLGTPALRTERAPASTADDRRAAAADPAPSGRSPQARRQARHRPRHRIGRHSRRRRAVALLGLAAVLVGVGGLAWWVRRVVEGVPDRSTAVVVVPPGGSLTSMVASLARAGVVGSGTLFHLWLLTQHGGVIQPGAYRLRRDEGFAAAVRALEAGPNLDRLVVPPGFTVAEIAARYGALGFSRVAFLRAATEVRAPLEPPDVHTLEGLLAPGTYQLVPGEPAQRAVEGMVARFDEEARAAGIGSGPAPAGLDPYQVVVVASLIEREARLAADRPKVARVVYNRLADHMRLQVDATVLYAEHRSAGPLTRADLETPSPYNTYVHAGLPPTPICSPSVASLVAALHPAPGDWLYYVVVSRDGAEAFSATYAGQQANIALAERRGLG